MKFKPFISGLIHGESVKLSEQFNFGHREILLASNNLDTSSIFSASIPHGWLVESNIRPYPIVRRKNLKPYPVLSWSKRSEIALKNQSKRPVFTIGSPWSHLLRSIGINLRTLNPYPQPSPAQNSTILYMPSHSIYGGTAVHNFKIDKLRERFDPESVTVCLFWLDFINPKTYSFFSEQNCDVICMGFKGASANDHPWSDVGGRVEFLPNLFSILSRFDVIALDEVSTPFWYAVSLGKSVYITVEESQFKWMENGNSEVIKWNNAECLEIVKPGLSKIMKKGLIEYDSELHEISLSEVGWDYTLGFTDLLSELDILIPEKIDKNIASPIAKFISSFDNK
jgi:hypothetical protein